MKYLISAILLLISSLATAQPVTPNCALPVPPGINTDLDGSGTANTEDLLAFHHQQEADLQAYIKQQQVNMTSFAIQWNAVWVLEHKPIPPVIPEVPTAMYSYSVDLSNALPLEGATLDQTEVFMFFANADKYSSFNYYCCKSANDNHAASVQGLTYSVDLSKYTTASTRELYVDATLADGSGYDSIVVNFSIDIVITIPPIVPTTTVTLSWVAPSEREDNSPMSLSDILGYKIYYGTVAEEYPNQVTVNDSTATGYTFTDFPTGKHYFVVTTRDTGGRESRYSTVTTRE